MKKILNNSDIFIKKNLRFVNEGLYSQKFNKNYIFKKTSDLMNNYKYNEFCLSNGSSSRIVKSLNLYRNELFECDNNIFYKNIRKSFTRNFNSENITTKQIELTPKNFKNYNPEIIDKNASKINIIDKLPFKLQHLLKLGRYDRPIGYMLLFYPCAWGLTLSTPFIDFSYIYNLFLFFSGSMLMRSSGCIINDMWDKNIDKLVERSKERPLAAGYISIKEASSFLALHLALSLGILLQLPYYSIIAGLGIMPIVCIYPYMKRITYLPQLFLGLSFNSGVIVGYPAFSGIFDIGIVLPFYFAGILWTLIYDTIYAHMDKWDDKKINVKSTALYFGEKTKMILYFLNFLMFVLFYIGLDHYCKKNDTNSQDLLKKENTNSIIQPNLDVKEISIVLKNEVFNFDKGLLCLGLGFFYQLYLIKNVNLNEPFSCLKVFKRNNLFGLIIFAGCLCKAYDHKYKYNKNSQRNDLSTIN